MVLFMSIYNRVKKFCLKSSTFYANAMLLLFLFKLIFEEVNNLIKIDIQRRYYR